MDGSGQASENARFLFVWTLICLWYNEIVFLNLGDFVEMIAGQYVALLLVIFRGMLVANQRGEYVIKVESV